MKMNQTQTKKVNSGDRDCHENKGCTDLQTTFDLRLLIMNDCRLATQIATLITLAVVSWLLNVPETCKVPLTDEPVFITVCAATLRQNPVTDC